MGTSVAGQDEAALVRENWPREFLATTPQKQFPPGPPDRQTRATIRQPWFVCSNNEKSPCRPPRPPSRPLPPRCARAARRAKERVGPKERLQTTVTTTSLSRAFTSSCRYRAAKFKFTAGRDAEDAGTHRPLLTRSLERASAGGARLPSSSVHVGMQKPQRRSYSVNPAESAFSCNTSVQRTKASLNNAGKKPQNGTCPLRVSFKSDRSCASRITALPRFLRN